MRKSLSRIVFWIVFKSAFGLYSKIRWFSLIFPPLYSSRYSCARSKVACRFHGHLPSGFCQLSCMLKASGPVRVCFSVNCLTWIAGAQGGNGRTGRPCSSLTTTPFCRRKARSGSYRHFDQSSLWRAVMVTLTLRACNCFLYFRLPALISSSSLSPSSSLSASSPLFGCCEWWWCLLLSAASLSLSVANLPPLSRLHLVDRLSRPLLPSVWPSSINVNIRSS